MIARPRLDRDAYLIVLEALAELYLKVSRSRKRIDKNTKLTTIYYLFWGLADKKIGRRTSWEWRWRYERNLRKDYREMIEKIKEIESTPETE